MLVPVDIILRTDVTKLPECRNGVRYEPKEPESQIAQQSQP